ncbi:MAG: NADH:ubiquinone reductase (Na(+)-transporting) subunit F [Deltaproteobacteria bacterium]|nr:MAG: NADH:ubiquinone reductase (Na(+)-transporting) subunit F [Deltaproteobacteria bacterium]
MTVGTATGVFAGVILFLVGILLVARSQLVPSGDVTIVVNDDPDKALKVSPGQTLLSALSAQKIFIPSACGGGGTCAMCKCQVLDGGGDILPTETGHINLRERKDNWRLACQVKVKQDMKIQVPDEIFGIKKWECEVVSNNNVATFIKEFVVRLPEGEQLDFEPGGYIQIDVPRYRAKFTEFDIEEEYREDWDSFKLWDLEGFNEEDDVFRAYSMANHPAEGNIIMLNIRIATPPRGKEVPPGVCSSYIFSRKPGDKVTISGPYGEFHIQETEREMVYIGGGAGMAPLRSHLFHLFHTLKTSRKVSYWYGARSLREMFYWDEFTDIEEKFPNFKFHLALSNPLDEDDWDGPVGFIHQVLYDNYLKDLEAPEDLEYYLCGPPLMNAAVLKMLDDLGVPDEMIRFDDFGG